MGLETGQILQDIGSSLPATISHNFGGKFLAHELLGGAHHMLGGGSDPPPQRLHRMLGGGSDPPIRKRYHANADPRRYPKIYLIAN